MGFSPGSPVAPPPITEEEAEACKNKFLEEQQQQIKASSAYQSRNRADPGRALSLTNPMFKRSTSTLINSLAPTVSWALPAVVKEPHLVVGKVKKMSGILGHILVLIGLLAGFLFLTNILEILKRLSWRWTSLSFPKGDMLCAFQSTGHPTTMHLHNHHALAHILPMISLDVSQGFVIFFSMLLLLCSLLFLLENWSASTILRKLQ